jgi:hypothetical protein
MHANQPEARTSFQSAEEPDEICDVSSERNAQVLAAELDRRAIDLGGERRSLDFFLIEPAFISA